MLRKNIEVETSKAPFIITECCILHNICEDARLPLPANDNEADSAAAAFPQPDVEPLNRIDNREAVQIRDTIKDMLAETQPLRRSFR